MFERFTAPAIKVVMLAQAEARRLGHNFVGTEQFLLGLIGEKNSAASKVLQSKGVTLKEARIKVEDIISRGKGFVPVEMPFTPRAKRVLELACEQAIELGHDFVAPEHLLLGILAANEGVAIRVLELFGIDLRGLRTTTISVLKGERKL